MSELFSEIYICYFQVIKSLIEQKNTISERELIYRIRNSCFEESILYLLPKLTEKGWGFYEKKDGVLHARLSEDFYVPLTTLQKSYLKAILSDDKITNGFITNIFRAVWNILAKTIVSGCWLYKRSCYKEPVRVLIKNRRNALERAMLQFANYEKSIRRLNEDTYECLIYYNKETETELLIEILSFGPMLKVVGNETFLRLIKERLIAQNHHISPSTSC